MKVPTAIQIGTRNRNETKVNENTPDQMAVVSFQASLTMPYKVKNKQTNKNWEKKKKTINSVK